MKSLETLEKVINDAFKDDTDPKRVEALGTIKAELEHVKKEADEQDKVVSESVSKVRDLLLNGGSFDGKKTEEIKPLSLDECFEEVTKGDKNE